jgi:hypothetical protein
VFGKSARQKAAALHEEAMALEAAGDTGRALEKYFRALQLDPARPTTHYNIGLVHKYRRQWPESFRHNSRAVELQPDDEAANWNLAIAATALRDWETARRVWRRLALPIEEGSGPIEADFGVTPVRLRPEDSAEVVWAQRVDPVRARILSIPYPDSGFRHGDVVLHDSAAVGYRMLGESERPVFNVFELFQPSSHSTYEAELRVCGPQDLESLQAICGELGVELEDWTTSVRTLCRQCSEGRPHEKHAHVQEQAWEDRHLVGLAAGDEGAVRQALERWGNAGRSVERLELALAP